MFMHIDPAQFRARNWGSVLDWLVLGHGQPEDLAPSGQ
jgi:hypothetical protein